MSRGVSCFFLNLSDNFDTCAPTQLHTVTLSDGHTRFEVFCFFDFFTAEESLLLNK